MTNHESDEEGSTTDPVEGSQDAASIEKIRILAIDHGEKRIGLAFKPEASSMALPIGVLEVRAESSAIETIRREISERGARIVVVGLPVHPDGRQAQRIKRFTRKLRKGVSGVRWRFVDESFTSEAADARLREADLGGANSPNDAIAACLILESFIQSVSQGDGGWSV